MIFFNKQQFINSDSVSDTESTHIQAGEMRFIKQEPGKIDIVYQVKTTGSFVYDTDAKGIYMGVVGGAGFSLGSPFNQRPTLRLWSNRVTLSVSGTYANTGFTRLEFGHVLYPGLTQFYTRTSASYSSGGGFTDWIWNISTSPMYDYYRTDWQAAGSPSVLLQVAVTNLTFAMP